jgi:predicted RNA-binding protein YlxR (DUF448 family)
VPRREPERTCIVSRAVRPADELIRFVVGPDGNVVPDLKHRLPGRGVWVSARKDAVAEAVRRRLFARAFKAQVQVAAALAGEIDEALRRDLKQALSLANKAGAVVSGFAKVEAALAAGDVAALVHAAEAAEDGRRKLATALRKHGDDAISGIPVVDELSGEELDLALGRSHVIHAGLVAGPGSDGFITRWRRLRSYRGAGAVHAGRPGAAGAFHPSEAAGPERNE